MPTVKLDDAVTESNKLESLPEAFSGRRQLTEGAIAALAYPWFLLLGAGKNHGRFEVNARRISHKLFPGNPEMTPEVVERILAIYAAKKLIVRYRDTEGRDLAALTKFRGWSEKRSANPVYMDPPGCEDRGDEWNVPVGPTTDAEIVSVLAPCVVPPKPAPKNKRNPEPPDTPEIRELIDFYHKVWPTKLLVPYSVHNRKAVHRTLSKPDYDMTVCKVAIFLAKHGVKDFYRDKNHDLEYLIRPGVIEQIVSGNSSFRLLRPDVVQTAHALGLYKALASMGFSKTDENRPVDQHLANLMKQVGASQPGL